MPDNAPHRALRHHVSGAIERGEAVPIVAQPDPAIAHFEAQTGRTVAAASVSAAATHCNSVLDTKGTHWLYDRASGRYERTSQ